ncbi:MAG TPA: hypothetical protein VFF27_07420 [Bacteroidia bacterium]|nr:hypothetical protein [Bacteroidia bacterium]
MKNLFTTFLLLTLSIQFVKAQESSRTNADKGNIITTAYMGFPNFLVPAIKDAYELTGPRKEQLDIRASVPIGIQASYRINNKLDIGAELSHESAKIKWRENETLFGSDSTKITHHYLLNAARIRLLVIANYHFKIKKNMDWYFGFGLGYNYNPIKLETDGIASVGNSPCFFPITAKTKLGFNYYLIKNLALNAEAGIGGPLLSLGITFKL